jgi:hypothetical protein
LALSPSGLHKFGRQNVQRSALVIRKAGDGLSDALRLAPVELKHGDEVAIVLRGVVVEVAFPAADRKEPDGDLVRQHIVDASEVVLVDQADVDHLLKAEAQRIRKLKDAAEGVEPLDGWDEASGNGAAVDGDNVTPIRPEPDWGDD